MEYGAWRSGKQHDLVRCVETLARRRVATNLQLSRMVKAFQIAQVASESRNGAEETIAYVDALVSAQYSTSSIRDRQTLRARARWLDLWVSVGIPALLRQLMAEISGPRCRPVGPDLLPVTSEFDRLLGELDASLDQFLETRLADQRAALLGRHVENS